MDYDSLANAASTRASPTPSTTACLPRCRLTGRRPKAATRTGQEIYKAGVRAVGAAVRRRSRRASRTKISPAAGEYFAECAVVKDFDPRQPRTTCACRRWKPPCSAPVPGGAWRAAGGFWPYAELFKSRWSSPRANLQEGVNLLDPDKRRWMWPCTWVFHLLPSLAAASHRRKARSCWRCMGWTRSMTSQAAGYRVQQRLRAHCGAQLTTRPGAQAHLWNSCGFAIRGGRAAIPAASAVRCFLARRASSSWPAPTARLTRAG